MVHAVPCVPSPRSAHAMTWCGWAAWRGPSRTRTRTWTWSCSPAPSTTPPSSWRTSWTARESSPRYIAQVYAEHPTSPLLFMGEDICGSGGPIFSPKWLVEQAVPRWHWIMDPVHDKGLKFLFHTDGHYGAALPIIMETLNADGLHPIERNGCNDIFEIHARYPKKLLFGNVCCEVTLPQGNKADVEDETLELLEKIGPDGGLVRGVLQRDPRPHPAGEHRDPLPHGARVRHVSHRPGPHPGAAARRSTASCARACSRRWRGGRHDLAGARAPGNHAPAARPRAGGPGQHPGHRHPGGGIRPPESGAGHHGRREQGLRSVPDARPGGRAREKGPRDRHGGHRASNHDLRVPQRELETLPHVRRHRRRDLGSLRVRRASRRRHRAVPQGGPLRPAVRQDAARRLLLRHHRAPGAHRRAHAGRQRVGPADVQPVHRGGAAVPGGNLRGVGSRAPSIRSWATSGAPGSGTSPSSRAPRCSIPRGSATPRNGTSRP